ncbi:Dual-specificity kinase, spindle pole body (SPB) duplication and spindle checkpoint function [Bonamia ostreae]|uniref:Dual-specificity kinase, spindle pole body (SPB) duplication and spindle checkpoint function n=1 Tax=Bonamia ostreae TaxID=126728 RepID=A0ABV2AKM9_9EUKA
MSLTSRKAFALKHIQIKNPSIIANFEREIELLEKLQGEGSIISLIDHERDYESQHIFMVFELAESDMAEFLKANAPLKLYSARYFWGQMVDAVRVLHKVCKLLSKSQE